MVISMFINNIKELHKSIFINLYLVGIGGIFLALSISGFTQAGFINVPSEKLWIFRTIFGIVAFLFVFAFVKIDFNFKNYSKLELYNIAGHVGFELNIFRLTAITYTTYAYNP
jgi:hypothetical protein